MNRIVEQLMAEGFSRTEAIEELHNLRDLAKQGHFPPEEILLDHGIVPTDEIMWALKE
jgi:hypothetical protein